MKKKIIIIVLTAAIILLGGILFFFLKDLNQTKAEIIDNLPKSNYSYSSLFENETIIFENYTFKDSTTFKKQLKSASFKKITKSGLNTLKDTFQALEKNISNDEFTASLNDFVDYKNSLNTGDYYYLNGSIDSNFTLYYYNILGDSLYIISTK